MATEAIQQGTGCTPMGTARLGAVQNRNVAASLQAVDADDLLGAMVAVAVVIGTVPAAHGGRGDHTPVGLVVRNEGLCRFPVPWVKLPDLDHAHSMDRRADKVPDADR